MLFCELWLHDPVCYLRTGVQNLGHPWNFNYWPPLAVYNSCLSPFYIVALLTYTMLFVPQSWYYIVFHIFYLLSILPSILTINCLEPRPWLHRYHCLSLYIFSTLSSNIPIFQIDTKLRLIWIAPRHRVHQAQRDEKWLFLMFCLKTCKINFQLKIEWCHKAVFEVSFALSLHHWYSFIHNSYFAFMSYN